jgi:hypothetical protein
VAFIFEGVTRETHMIIGFPTHQIVLDEEDLQKPYMLPELS